MSKQSTVIFSTAIDLGAKNTGVYAVGYKAGITLEDFKGLSKIGFVAEAPGPKNNGYKLIQADRTANRHARRNRTRNQQAKRLLKIVLELCFDFPISQHEVSINHFMNRRGFSYLDKGVNADKINSIDSVIIDTWLQKLSEINDEYAHFIVDKCTSNDLFAALSQLVTRDDVDLHLLRKSTQVEGTPRSKIDKELVDIKNYFQEIIRDLESGSKPRRKFFQNIMDDLQKLGTHPEKHNRMFFNALKHHREYYDKDFIQIFHLLVSHISNFDLKSLNKILKNIRLDTLTASELEKKLADNFGHWIMKLWVVSPVNGEKRVKEIGQLRNDWATFRSNHPNKVFEFLLNTYPVLTIPPYENHTNRRPPSCQTLIFNPEQLQQDYPDWKKWLAILIKSHPHKEMIEGYKQKLRALTSGKSKVLVDERELDARLLHFILDASQSYDPFNLNQIWSQMKEAKLTKRQGKDGTVSSAKIKRLLESSVLDSSLLVNVQSVIEPSISSFWHLINKYYQLRRRTRDGRYFIHYDNLQPNQSRWQTQGNLLVMCHHRPRQLKHQAYLDVAALLGLDATFLQERIGEESGFEDFFKEIKGLCKLASKAQKDYGIDLKTFSETNADLRKLKQDAKVRLGKIAVKLGYDANQQVLFVHRNASIFTLAQLQSLVFGERSGFGKTCPVCAVDNAYRMIGSEGSAVASRLNTLTMRLIDGALKRLLTHKAHHIANRLWPEILKTAAGAEKVIIPFILEQNKFDFTSHLPELKGRDIVKLTGVDSTKASVAKEERIQQASKYICPYSGDELAGKQGDIDHIIPRSGGYGILNDEANLIYCSSAGNRDIKKDRVLTLSDLSVAYLEKQFGTSDVAEIKKIIYNTIYDESTQSFKFGRYRQFIGLDAPSQIAFRHALFLAIDDPLRKAVIEAIVHRNKSRVNGAQRYMAQLLADIFYKKSKKSGVKFTLHFDYFEISSNPSDENSTVSLRKHLRNLIEGNEWDIKPFDKKEGIPQKPYSHVIDAILAFMIALQEHQGEGALQVKLPENSSIWGYFDAEGVLCENMFSSIAVSPSDMQEKVAVVPQTNIDKLEPLLANSELKPHDVNSRMLFVQNALGLEFYDLQEIDGKLTKGYMDYSGSSPLFVSIKPIKDRTGQLQLAVAQGYYRRRELANNQYLYKPNKTKLIECIFNTLSEIKDLNPPFELLYVDLLKWLFDGNGGGQLFYYSKKDDLLSAPHVLSKNNADTSKYTKIWQKFYEGWIALHPDTQVRNGSWIITPETQSAWNEYCRTFLQREDSGFKHSRVKDFRLKSFATASGVLTLVKRKDGNNKYVYQLIPIDNKAYSDNESMVMIKKSPNLVKFSKDILKNGYAVEPLIKLIDPTGNTLEVSKFLKIDQCEILSLDVSALVITALSKTTIEVKGIPTEWFQEQLLKLDKQEWQSKVANNKTWSISAEVMENTLHIDTIKKILVRSFRSDKPIIIRQDNSGIVIEFKYKDVSFFGEDDTTS